MLAMPHQQAGHMTAPDQGCIKRKKALVNLAPSTHDPGCVKTLRLV
jgi:hypothetical protein